MTRYICQNCGDTVRDSDDLDPWDCSYCGGRVIPEDKSDVVPKDDLRELVKEWREIATDNIDHGDEKDLERGYERRVCAKELEMVIGE